MLHLTIVGNLGADAGVKEANGKKFVSFNVAHTERWTDDNGQQHESTQWVSCALSGDGGNLLQYLKKGTTIYATGRLKTRVYSSEKARSMVAGLDLSVQHIELIGSRPDDVPSRLFTHNGLQVDITKHFWTANAEVYGSTLYDQRANPFSIDASGWVSRVQQAPAEPAPAETERNDDPFEGDASPLSQKVTNKRKVNK